LNGISNLNDKDNQIIWQGDHENGYNQRPSMNKCPANVLDLTDIDIEIFDEFLIYEVNGVLEEIRMERLVLLQIQ
jgi:hypothetical protein